MSDVTQATGKRKSAVARVRMSLGTGQITVNGRIMDEYFPREALQILILRRFHIFVAKEFLYRSNILSAAQKMRCKTVTKRMDLGHLHDS